MNWMLSESTETGIGSVGTYRQGVCNGQLAVIKAGSEGKPLISQASVEFTDLIACLFSFYSEGGAIHALNTSRKETYLRLGAINNLQ